MFQWKQLNKYLKSIMITFNEYCKNTFGEKVYKLSLDAGFSCPNRDGTLGERGCIFCSKGGSGEFTPDKNLPIDEQIRLAKEKVKDKFKGDKFIAYFQAFTNTYAPVEKLEKVFMPVILRDDIVGISIGTRPDCLGEDVLNLIKRLNNIKPVIIELGLQSTNEKTAKYIRRGYPLEVYDTAVKNLKKIDVHVVTHVILGLPGETKGDMITTIKHVVNIGSDGIKLQLLTILKDTDLAVEYEKGNVHVLSEEEYLDILHDCINILPENMVVHRLTGDPPKSILIAPLWCANKKEVLAKINKLINNNKNMHRKEEQ